MLALPLPSIVAECRECPPLPGKEQQVAECRECPPLLGKEQQGAFLSVRGVLIPSWRHPMMRLQACRQLPLPLACLGSQGSLHQQRASSSRNGVLDEGTVQKAQPGWLARRLDSFQRPFRWWRWR